MTGKLEYKVGNLFDNIPQEKTIIAHVVNNKSKMGAGFVIPLMQKFPTLKEEFIKASSGKNEKELLGHNFYHTEKDNDNTIIANMFAQDGFGNVGRRPHPLSYDALEICMRFVAKAVKDYDIKGIICPKFGSGLSGGDFRIIEAMIRVFWIDEGIDVTIFSLE